MSDLGDVGPVTLEVAPRRLHPATPLMRGWRFVVAVLAFSVPQAGQAALGGDSPSGGYGLVLLAVLPVAALYGFLSWRATTYRVQDGALHVDSGILTKQSRRVRLDRLQAVDVVQPLLGRALGTAELRLEVVGGGNTEAPLAYLSMSDAQALRARLLASAAGLDEHTPEAPERILHEVPGDRLVRSTLLTTAVVVGVVLVPVALVVATMTGETGLLLLFVPSALSILGPLLQAVLGSWGFTLAESPDGLRIRRGLIETRSQTVPPGRIQAVRIVEPWLWRRFTDWVRVEVDLAGYAGGDGTSTSGVLLPVAPRADALALLHRVLPGVDLAAIELAGVPRSARWVDPIGWRRLGVGTDDRFLVARRGVVRRQTDVMPHERTQSIRAVQGPLQRRLGLASVVMDTTPGPVTVTAAHRDAREAVALARDQAERARVARSVATPDRWMSPAAGPRTPVPRRGDAHDV